MEVLGVKLEMKWNPSLSKRVRHWALIKCDINTKMTNYRIVLKTKTKNLEIAYPPKIKESYNK